MTSRTTVEEGGFSAAAEFAFTLVLGDAALQWVRESSKYPGIQPRRASEFSPPPHVPPDCPKTLSKATVEIGAYTNYASLLTAASSLCQTLSSPILDHFPDNSM